MPPTAVVTGCAGFVGSELCKQLLARGFIVRGTVRNAAAPRSLELLAALKQAVPEGALSLVEADLLQPGAFDAAFEGADYIFHNASPFAIVVEDPQRDVRGTHSVHAWRHIHFQHHTVSRPHFGAWNAHFGGGPVLSAAPRP